MGFNPLASLKGDPSVMSTGELIANDMYELGACHALQSLLHRLDLNVPVDGSLESRDPDLLLQWVLTQVQRGRGRP